MKKKSGANALDGVVRELAVRKGAVACGKHDDAERVGGLSSAAAAAYASQWSEGTRFMYGWHWNNWCGWLRARGLEPAGAGEVDLANFLADGGLSVAGVRARYTGVRMGYQAHGMAAPEGPALDGVRRGLMKSRARDVRRAKPLTDELVRTIVRGLPDVRRTPRDRSLLTLGFGGALRESEIVALRWSDIWIAGEFLVVRLRKSKAAVGPVEVSVAPGGERDVCPHRLLFAWGAAMRDRGLPTGPEDSVFRLRTGSVTGLVRRCLRQVVPELDARKFSSHSLRAGFATSAYVAGTPPLAIREHMRHSSMRMLEIYIRDVRQRLEHPGKGLL